MLSFQRGSDRKTECYIVTIGDVEAFISYTTILAIRSPKGHGRLENSWGPTTGRHINEMGLRDWPLVTPAELASLAEPPAPLEPLGPHPVGPAVVTVGLLLRHWGSFASRVG